MTDKNLQSLLYDFIKDPEIPETNFQLAIYYDKLNQTASAVSYYLRAAERSKSDLIKYQCILRAGLCFTIQECRNTTVKGLFQHALTIQPKRPEGYFLLSRFYEKEKKYHDSYLIASIGEQIAEKDVEPLLLDLEYPGFYGILFEKAVSSWWVGLCDESRSILKNLYNNYNLDETHVKAVIDNLKRIDPNFVGEFDFDWGENDENMKTIISKEIFEEKIYEKYFSVKEGDIVVDIGSNVGAFSYSISNKKPKHIYCIEPSNNLVKTIKNNLKNVPHTIVDCAFIDIDSNCVEITDKDYIYSHSGNVMKTMRFKTFIDQYKIDRINFLKVDCEGGEYDIFNEENRNFLLNSVDHIVGEWHFTGIQNFLYKFSKFRDLYLKEHTDYQVFEGCGKNITDKIFDDEYLIGFEKWYREVGDGQLMIYINNTTQEIKNFSIQENKKEIFLINSKTHPTYWAVDNFYENPDALREFALKQEYHIGGIGRGYIGNRTHQQFLFPGLKEKFEKIMGKKITKWEEYGMNGRFQYCWAGQPLVYHCDSQMWGGMLYLTPNAPFQCGTTLYAHKQTKARSFSDDGWDVSWKDVPGDPHLDGTPFESVDVLGNVYNRLVIFDASCIHSASQYFGTIKETARLWQMFFFDT